MSITINTKVFDVTRRPSESSVILTTFSRGATLPDTVLLDHRTKKNPVESGSVNKVHKISVGRTYINADGVVKQGYVSKQLDIPDDMVQSDIDAMQADLDDYEFSAKTVRTTVRASLESGFIP